MKANTWVETDVAALATNVAIFRRRLAPGARLGVVVKSNAYGHGAAVASTAFVAAGADWLIVNDAEEALAMKETEALLASARAGSAACKEMIAEQQALQQTLLSLPVQAA